MSGQKRHSTANVVALLNRYQCPTPFHAVRARFMGSIVSPVPDNSPVHTIQELWGGKFPPFDSMDDLNHLLHVLMDGLWNRLTAHQTASKPFKLTRVQVKQTREGVHHYALLRKVFVLTSPAEIDGIGVDAGCFQTSCGTIFGAII
ncbi:MAG: hypothetical protein ABSG41_29015, partial [Bryobacteraceae bacterium]